MIATRLSPLYDVKLISSNRQHFYQIGDDEKWLPGVTTVLSAAIPKPALLPWALNCMGENIREFFANHDGSPIDVEALIKESKDIYKKKSSEAADIGSRVHAAINAIIKGEKTEITDDIKAGVDGFLSWKESNHLTIELGDTRLGSKLYGYGGSLDMVAFDGDEAIIFDFKTTKKRKDRNHGIYPEAALQLSSYSVAFRETYGLNVKAVYGLWLDKEKGGFKEVKVSNINACFEGFLAALKLYQMSKYEYFDEQPKI